MQRKHFLSPHATDNDADKRIKLSAGNFGSSYHNVSNAIYDELGHQGSTHSDPWQYSSEHSSASMEIYSQSHSSLSASGNDDEYVCYGMLHDVPARVKWPPNESQDQYIWSLPEGRYVPLSLVLQDRCVFLDTTNGEHIAVLNNSTCDGLSGVLNDFMYGSQVLVAVAEWGDATSKVDAIRKAKNLIQMKTVILIFGPRSSATNVAKSLAASRLFLQDPLLGAFQGLYENPQSLDLPGHPNPNEIEHEIHNLNMIAIQESDELRDTTSDVSPEQVSSLLINIDAFLDTMPTHGYLSQLPIDNRIMAKLLNHQTEGVDFINRRELGACPPDRSLWAFKLSENGDEYYEHLVTGAKSRLPSDCRSGLLADDMGLGKTLTTLSAVVGSLNRAQEFANRGGKRSAKSTVIVVPSELLLNSWETEIKKYGAVRYVKYHGIERREYDASLSEYDIILTTYGTAISELRRRTSALYETMWYRLVLDEAHMIRNCSSKQFEAANGISSNMRWCISGTPIQNSLEDLGSLTRFLKVPILDDAATFRKHISKVRRHDDSRKEEFENLRLLLNSVCLRRSKNILPGLGHTTEHRYPDFTQQERDQYRALELACKRAITFAVRGHSKKQGNHRVMEALLRLRMFCNNGPDGSSANAAFGPNTQPDEILSLFQQSGEAMCSYCTCDIVSISGIVDSDTAYLTQCLRLVCSECTAQYRSEHQESGTSSCPLCKSKHTIGDMDLNYSTGQVTLQPQYPSKVVSLVHDIQTHYLADKCVVFSFWKKTLDVVGKALANKQLRYLRVDGDVTPRKRKAIIMDFQSRSASRILLMTFSTGSLGLNGLTVANRVHILEPQWNPAVENQAIGRLLRIDQEKQVTVVRYAMRKSIEEIVQSKQLRKLQLAVGGFTADGNKAQQMQQLEEFLDSVI